MFNFLNKKKKFLSVFKLLHFLSVSNPGPTPAGGALDGPWARRDGGASGLPADEERSASRCPTGSGRDRGRGTGGPSGRGHARRSFIS